MANLSVVIITFNEERNIAWCCRHNYYTPMDTWISFLNPEVEEEDRILLIPKF